MPYTLSPSTLSLFKDCPRCFWLAFNKGIKRPAGIFPSLPSGMDGLLKKHFDTFMEKGQLPPELKDIQAKLFSDKELLKKWRNNLQGIQWTDEQGNRIRGAIDNLLEKDGKLIILDYKTRGYPLKDDTASYYQDQLDIYNLLFRKNGYETEDYAILLFYHPTHINEKGEVIFHTDLIRMHINVKNAETIIQNALHTLKASEPKGECAYCAWAKNSLTHY
ncbi:MAG: PD-(D/E)XK nuclease family protein [Nanoarchaeota archaeon]